MFPNKLLTVYSVSNSDQRRSIKTIKKIRQDINKDLSVKVLISHVC